MLLFLLRGLAIHFRGRRILRGGLLAAVTLCLLLLCLTYSRGGYPATLLTLGLCQLLSLRPISSAPKLRDPFPDTSMPLVLGGMLLLLFLVPAGGSRRAKTADFQDRSILNRPWLWRGGAILTSKCPWKGYPLEGENPGFLYSTYYQPLERRYAYTSLLNSTLDTAQKGMPWLWSVSLLAFTLRLLALLAWRKFQDSPLPACRRRLVLLSCGQPIHQLLPPPPRPTPPPGHRPAPPLQTPLALPYTPSPSPKRNLAPSAPPPSPGHRLLPRPPHHRTPLPPMPSPPLEGTHPGSPPHRDWNPPPPKAPQGTPPLLLFPHRRPPAHGTPPWHTKDTPSNISKSPEAQNASPSCKKPSTNFSTMRKLLSPASWRPVAKMWPTPSSPP